MQADRLRRLLACLDLTRLNPDDDPAAIAAFCASANNRHHLPAAVCVRPEFLTRAVETLTDQGLRSRVRVATVANFPGGDQPLDAVIATISGALAAGADEIDVVLPWREIAAGPLEGARRLLAAARERTTGRTLKVILETGALSAATIDRAADLALDHGVDFLKTSTGFGHPGADPHAAERLLDRISSRAAPCGLKVSGGIRTPEAADAYLALAEQCMGPDWPRPGRFRIGASGLYGALIDALDAAGDEAAPTP